jgi:hypothetical protein
MADIDLSNPDYSDYGSGEGSKLSNTSGNTVVTGIEDPNYLNSNVNSLYSDYGTDTTSYNSDGTINPEGTAYASDLISNSMFSGSDLAKLFKDSPLLKTLGAVGMGKLADKLFDVQKGPGGYRGGIPTLTASRQQLPIPASMMNAAGAPMLDAKGVPIPRRPGSGGVTYFTPMQYLKAGQTPAATGIATTLPAESVAAPVEVAAAGGLMGYAHGGIANLGGYSDGGRLLRGPGDGVSDSIPAMIGKRQPARLADGEFVIPARIVSELGNGSTEAGARKLYAMMDRIKKARGKAKNIAADTKSDKHLPA